MSNTFAVDILYIHVGKYWGKIVLILISEMYSHSYICPTLDYINKEFVRILVCSKNLFYKKGDTDFGIITASIWNKTD